MKKEKTGLSVPKIILIGLVMAILGVGGGALGSFLTSDKALAFIQQAEEEEPVVYTAVPYSEFLINLKPTAKNDKSFLRIAFTFSVAGEENATYLTDNEAKIRDAIIALLRQKTAETIFAEAEGALIIKEEIKAQMNQLVGNDSVKEVFVTDMVMQ